MELEAVRFKAFFLGKNCFSFSFFVKKQRVFCFFFLSAVITFFHGQKTLTPTGGQRVLASREREIKKDETATPLSVDVMDR